MFALLSKETHVVVIAIATWLFLRQKSAPSCVDCLSPHCVLEAVIDERESLLAWSGGALTLEILLKDCRQGNCRWQLLCCVHIAEELST